MLEEYREKCIFHPGGSLSITQNSKAIKDQDKEVIRHQKHE